MKAVTIQRTSPVKLARTYFIDCVFEKSDLRCVKLILFFPGLHNITDQCLQTQKIARESMGLVQGPTVNFK